MPWEIPEPARWIRQASSCIPVPAEATRPMGPRRTALANPMPAPASHAVPQSGPMTTRPRRRASVLSDRSSSTETLLEKRKTCRPCCSAARTSRAAWAPGTEITATDASGRRATASAMVWGPPAAASPPAEPASRESHASALAATASTAASSPSSASTTSLGPAEARSGSPAP